MEIIAILFFEANTEDLVVQLATDVHVTDDRTKARDEQYLDVSHFVHVIHHYHGESGVYNQPTGYVGLPSSSCRKTRLYGQSLPVLPLKCKGGPRPTDTLLSHQERSSARRMPEASPFA